MALKNSLRGAVIRYVIVIMLSYLAYSMLQVLILLIFNLLVFVLYLFFVVKLIFENQGTSSICR